jgi:hypothetical protein
MGQEVRRRPQGSIAFEANSKVSLRIGRGMVYRELHLLLEGAPTLAGAANTLAATLRGDEWAVVKRIELIANNTQVIRSLSGNDLWWLNYFLFGTPPPITPAMGDGATANVPFASSLVIPLWMPRSIRPMTTALDARQLSDLKLEITWGNFADINAAATAWTTEPTVKVASLESFNVQGTFSQWRVFTIEKEITATNPQFQIDIPVGPAYRGFMLGFTDAGKDDGDILNNFKIVSGSTVYADITERLLEQVDGHIRNSLIHSFDSGAGAGGVYDAFRRGTTYNSVDGLYFYDHVTDGYLTEAIDTLGLSEFKLELDVTVGGGTTKVYVLPMQIVPVRGKRK